LTRSIPPRLAGLALVALLSISIVSIAVPRSVPADPPSGAWLASQAMGVTTAAALAAAKLEIQWNKGMGLDDGGFCMVGVHLAKGSAYTGSLALKKDVKYRIHGFSGTSPDVELTLVDPAGNKVATSSPRDDAGAVLTTKAKDDGAYTLRMAYAGSQAGVQACAYVVVREGGVPIPPRVIEATMSDVAGRLDTFSSANPAAHFLPTDGQVAAVATAMAPSTDRSLPGIAFPDGSNWIVAVGDSLTSDVDLTVSSAAGVSTAGTETAGVPLSTETVAFSGSGAYTLKIANAASAGPNLVVGLFLASGGSAVSAAPAAAAAEAPDFARPMDQAVRHGLTLAAFLADEAENRLADGPSIMAGLLKDGMMFQAPRQLLPGITYTIIASGDEGVGQVELAVLDPTGNPAGESTQGAGYATTIIKPQSVSNAYTLRVRQVKSTGGRHACAVLTFRQAGAGLSYDDIRQCLDNLDATLRKVAASSNGPPAFNDMGGQVSLYGTTLAEQESRTYAGVGFPVGNHVVLASADGRAKDIDIVVASDDKLTTVKDKDVSPNPIVDYNGVGTVSIKVTNRKSSGTSMTALAILNVPGPQ
jgi:hypothetical protein